MSGAAEPSVKKASGRGGARPGAGRKSAAAEAELAPLILAERKAKVKKLAYDAQMAELSFKVRSGEYLPREEIRAASATAMSIIAQAMRSIPDNLERRLGVSPGLAEEVALIIDETLANLADELERLHRGG